MRRADVLIAVAGIACMAPSAAQANEQDYAVSSGRLDRAIAEFGAQSGLTIAIADARLGQRRTRGVKGRYSPRAALRQLLRGTGAAFVFINQRTVRIVAAPHKRPTRHPQTASRSQEPQAPVPPPKPVEIVVTASKQNILLENYAGSVDVVNFNPDSNARSASRGTAAIVARLPLLSSTGLGPGRDKLFIRGVADSSFSGPTQATVGQYLGDARLTYNAPDPDLHLYDLDRVEILAGPQGTLYGTGALGGIIRLVPNAPDPAAITGSASLGIGTTQHGASSNDAAAMLNLPLARDRLAFRAVGYRVLDGGYIDDPSRGLADINSSEIFGGRLALRYQPGDHWVIDAGGLLQEIENRDGQYTLRGDPALTRNNTVPQPFDNDITLAQLRIGKSWESTELVSSTSVVRHHLSSIFDATLPEAGAPPRLFEDDSEVNLLAHETRLSGQRSGGEDWVAGLALITNRERRERLLGDPDDPETISITRATFSEAALFGQFAFALAPGLAATLGGRLIYSRTTGKIIGDDLAEEFEPGRNSIKALPSLSLAWRTAGNSLVFLRYQKGTRAGGLSVGGSAGSASVQRFEGDTMAMIEAGFRHGTPGRDPFAAGATLSYSKWTDIQADLVDASGQPFTVNMGDGRIIGIDANLTWMPANMTRFELSTFINRTTLTNPEPAFLFADERDLPNVAEIGGRAAISWRTNLTETASLTLDGSVRYVGPSQLGIGPPLDVAQGDYVEANMGGRIEFGRFGISLDASNLANVRGNRFAYGNPFGLASRNQITPLRPRSLRIGIDASF